MKRISYLICGLVITLYACSDEVVIDSSIAEANDYGNVYIPQAAKTENRISVYVSNMPQSFNFSAGYGGFKPAGQDIKVNFEVNIALVDAYNEANAKDFLPMPEGSYSMEKSEAFIKAGTYNTGALKMNIHGEKLEAAKFYLLPVSITGITEGEKLNKNLRDAYFIISGAYEPGNVPRELAYSFGNIDNAGGVIFFRNDDMVQRTPDGFLLVYKTDENGVFDEPRVISGPGWEALSIVFFNSNNMMYGKFADNGNIERYFFDENYNYLGQGTIGWGWFDHVIMMPFKDFMLLGVLDDGRLRAWNLVSDGSLNWGNLGDIVGRPGRNYLDYIHLFPYIWAEDDSGYLIAVDETGVMLLIPVSDSGSLASEVNIGFGWDMYVKVFSSGTDLLALDENGDLWRYRFNPHISWPLKEVEEEEKEEE